MNEQTLARGLGWFSIGLGLAELLAPRQVGRAIGVRGKERVLQMMGVRELTSGVGILTQRRSTPWLWSRVAGDAMDLGLLGGAMRGADNDRRRLGAAIAAVAGVAALDVICSLRQSQRDAEAAAEPIHSWSRTKPRADATFGKPIHKAITINRPADEIYRFWRNFENLPRFMNHLDRVTALSDTQSHWVAKGPAGLKAEWDAEIVEDHPNEMISWRSLPGSRVENEGAVYFEPATGNRGTIVRVEVKYRPPGGALGKAFAALFGEAPSKQIAVDLHRVKQLLETGEIATTEGQPSARASSTSARYDDFVRR
jgi:uncharacterized membrane protein